MKRGEKVMNVEIGFHAKEISYMLMEYVRAHYDVPEGKTLSVEWGAMGDEHGAAVQMFPAGTVFDDGDDSYHFSEPLAVPSEPQGEA